MSVEFPGCKNCKKDNSQLIQENENLLRMSECLKDWLSGVPGDWLNEDHPNASVREMQCMIASMRIWLSNIPEQWLSGEIKEEATTEDFQTIQKQQTSPGDPGQLPEHEMMEEHADDPDLCDEGGELVDEGREQDVQGLLTESLVVNVIYQESENSAGGVSPPRSPSIQDYSSNDGPKVMKLYPCDICNKTFKRLADMKRHKQTHVARTRYSCDQCDFSAFETSRLNRHIQLRHITEAEDIKPYPCDQCSRSFNDKTSLNRHIDSSHTGIVHPCIQCGKVFKRTNDLKTHEKKHEGILYPCDQCEFSSTAPELLKRHKQRIHEEKKFQCDHCPYTGSTSGNLKLHIESRHLGIRYPCAQCGFQASSKRRLVTHKEAKHGPTIKYPSHL